MAFVGLPSCKLSSWEVDACGAAIFLVPDDFGPGPNIDLVVLKASSLGCLAPKHESSRADLNALLPRSAEHDFSIWDRGSTAISGKRDELEVGSPRSSGRVLAFFLSVSSNDIKSFPNGIGSSLNFASSA